MAASAAKEIWDPIAAAADEASNRVKYVSCDVTSEESVERAFAEATKHARYPLRGLVTCAGISGRKPAVDYPVDEFRRIMDINVTGTFLCARVAAKIMHSQNVSGSIVMFASMSGTNVNKVCRQSSVRDRRVQLTSVGSRYGGLQYIEVCSPPAIEKSGS